ncbi:hypothetical protein SDC9_64793 [bioreactor metagenome]|uniref:Uncharacterized protein n=1 Tax=bioreactor metagenome TaxID=1076179 RepID=A0A644XWE7_9ZZZZ|nr:hypothetical protein [Sphaerochaeta sp.]
MNKRLIAIALVLVIAVSGVFAVTSYPSNVSARLLATAGPYFTHGFGSNFSSTIDVINAFAATPPAIDYRYATNVGGAKIRFSITDFAKAESSDVVKIKSITATTSTLSPISLTWDAGLAMYLLFDVASVSAFSSQTALITVNPARTANVGTADHRGSVSAITEAQTVEGAIPGDYIATMTFQITAT